MINTSFLRTLSLKRYQDFAQENRNRLKVYYRRTINKINKEAKLAKIPPKIFNKCNCKSASKQKNQCSEEGIQGLGYLTQQNSKQNIFKRIMPVKSCVQHLIMKQKQWIQPTKIIMDFQTTRLQCQKRLQKMEKQIFLQSRKLAFGKRNKKLQQKKLNSINFFSTINTKKNQ